MYGVPLETTFVKTLVGNAEVSTNALRTTGTVLRTAEALAGVAGLGITAISTLIRGCKINCVKV